ncbi:MAG TPA: hypothetical protein VKR53_03795 [Puia sp.]|nr:hypothetical protein [Puia sp.]
MKKTLPLLASFFAIVIIAFIPPGKSIHGSWMIKYGNNQKINIDFRKNGTVKVVIPSENFTVEGKFKLKDDMLYLNDGTCGLDYWGKYKTTFFSNDSIYTVLTEDSCGPRKSAMDKATLVRVKMQ